MSRGFVSRLPSRSQIALSDFSSAADVLNEKKPEFLVQGLLFPASPFSIFGLPGVGKSLIALLLAVSVAARKPFLMRAINLTHPVSVIYVAAEGKGFIGARLRAMCEEHGFTKADLVNLHVLRRPVAVTDLAAVEDFINAIKLLLRNRPPLALVLFDTLTKCLGRAGANENDPRDMALLADCIDAVAESTGAAVGFVDHTGWRGEHERGHSNKRANVETAMLVKRSADGTVKLRCEKSNHADAFEGLNLQIEKRADAAVVTLLAVSLPITKKGIPAVAARPLLESDRKALQALAGESSGVAFTRWVNIADLPQATLDRARKRLTAAKLIQAEGPDTRPRYSLTAEGARRASEPEAAS